MAVHQTTRTRLIPVLAAAALLIGFFIMTYHLTRESLWDDEGYTMGLIRDRGRPPESISEILQYVRTSLSDTLNRVRTADIHPPLYYLSLDVWSLLVGDSVYTVRLYSALCGLVALAGTYAAGKTLFADPELALFALLLLATASFFVYYAREARMYTLFATLAVLSVTAYVRWSRQPTTRRALFYAGTMAALLYTHYAGVFVVLAQMIHGLKRSPRFVVPYAVAALLFAPWIPFALEQWRVQGGPGALPLPTNLGTIAALLLILTNGFGWLYAGVVAMAFIRHNTRALMLLLLWITALPAALLLLNTWVRPLFQIRYVLPILPALALLLALGVRNLPAAALRFGFLALLLVIQLTTYSQFWPNKPRWEDAARQMAAVRRPLEPAITSISPYSPAAYYDRLHSIWQGISLDLAWRWQESSDMARYVDHLRASPSVWLVMPSNFASTWDALTAVLENGYRVGYRDSVMNTVFYRFDRSSGSDLQFRFGDALAWRGGIGHHLYARAGEPFCFDLRFRALGALNSGYAVDLALTQGYNTRRAEHSLLLNTADAGTEVRLSPCIDVPAENPPGPHHLRVRVMYNGASLPLIEGENLYWSEELIPALVSVA